MRLFYRHLASIFLLLSIPIILIFPSRVLSDAFSSSASFLQSPPYSFITQSRFRGRVETKTEPIHFETRFVDDPESEIGTEVVIQEGESGVREIETAIVFYDGEEYSRTSVEKVIQEPVDKLISRGTKIVNKTLDTELGVLTYWRKIPVVWATSYDSTCPGCSQTTATGMKQGYGVVAVDPSVIPLHTKLYIPGYGIAVAGDVGGSIEGKRIDLGFDSLNGQWKARFVDVYFLVD